MIIIIIKKKKKILKKIIIYFLIINKKKININIFYQILSKIKKVMALLSSAVMKSLNKYYKLIMALKFPAHIKHSD